MYLSYGKDINIYELMHLMKEWANNNSYLISSDVDGNCRSEYVYNNHPSESYNEDTEFEAVIKACEWILKEAK